jgi:protein involved in polysaccharide export with SLBB domain
MVGVAKYMVKVGGLCFAAGLGLAFGGCAAGTPDSPPPGRFRATPAVNPILSSLGAADEPAAAWQNAEEPKPQDVIAVKNDGTLRPGDTVRVSIFELLQENAMATNDYLVSDVGKISLPEVGLVQAGGQTEAQVEDEIKRVLRPAILKNPSVSVTRIRSQPQMFAVLGLGAGKPGRYTLPNEPLRLTDALAEAGGTQSNVTHIYISRSVPVSSLDTGLLPSQGIDLIEPQTRAPTSKPSREPVIPPAALPGSVPQPSQPAEKFEKRQDMLELITPSARAMPKANDLSLIDDSGKVRGTSSDETNILAASLPRDGVPRTFRPVEKSEKRPNASNIVLPPAKAKPRADDKRPKGDRNSSVRDLSSDGTDAVASTVPAGFRGLMPPSVPGQPGPNREQIVQSLVEFGFGQAPPAASTPRDVKWVFQDGQWVSVPAPASPVAESNESTPQQTPDLQPREMPQVPQPPKPAPKTPVVAPTAGAPAQEQGEWIFQDGRWVQLGAGRPDSAKPSQNAIPIEPVSTDRQQVKVGLALDSDQETQPRMIKVPLDRLLAGDPRYNVVIRPGDVIHVPADVAGEFYVTGNVLHSGRVSMNGRSMTLRQALAEAGGLKSLAQPRYCEITRRVAPDREETVTADLDRILRGEQPDVAIKPNDVINVGALPAPESGGPITGLKGGW